MLDCSSAADGLVGVPCSRRARRLALKQGFMQEAAYVK